MHLPQLHVAIVHEYFGLGGAEQVSLHTGKLLAQLGVHTHYYGIRHEEGQWTLPDPIYTTLTLLPERHKLWTKENVQYLLADADKRGIRVLIIPVSNRNKYLDQLRSTGLKLIYWLHSTPFSETSAILRVMEERAKRHALRQLEWLLFRKPWYLHLGATQRKVEHRYRQLIQQVDRLLTLCPAYSQEIVTTLQLPEELAGKLYAIPNTIDLPPASQIQLDKEKKIVYMGRLDPISKQVSRLVHIWAKIHQALPDWEVEIYGEGEEQASIERLITQHRLPRISLRGYCASPSAVYQRASLLALTSHIESWGLVLAEAQSYGCIPIAFACSSGVREVLGHDPTCGRLIPPDDLEAYAKALLELCQDPALRQALQQACIQKSRVYAHEQNLARWRELLEGL